MDYVIIKKRIKKTSCFYWMWWNDSILFWYSKIFTRKL